MRTARTEHLSIGIMASLPHYRQSHPTHDRASYEHVRRHVRTLRRHSPTHYDVLWYQESLGIVPYEVWVTKRWGYSFVAGGWEEVPRGARARGWVGTYIATVGPFGKLP